MFSTSFAVVEDATHFSAQNIGTSAGTTASFDFDCSLSSVAPSATLVPDECVAAFAMAADGVTNATTLTFSQTDSLAVYAVSTSASPLPTSTAATAPGSSTSAKSRASSTQITSGSVIFSLILVYVCSFLNL